MQTEMSSSPAGGLPPTEKHVSYHRGQTQLACWLTYRYFNALSNIVNKKTAKKQLFLAFYDRAGNHFVGRKKYKYF